VLVGHPPFRAASDAETLQQVLHEEPVRPSHLRPDMPRPLEAICLKCLRKEPGQRYPSAGELAHDLQRFLQGESVQARAPGALVRLAAWCRRPEQVQQAGRSLFGFGLLLAAWCVGCLILLGCGQLTAERPAVAVRSLLSWMFLLYLPMSLCGWNVLAGRPRALWPGILFALLLTGCLIVSLLGFALFDLGGITEGPKGDVPINLLLFLVATLVTVACGVGLVAQHSNKRK